MDPDYLAEDNMSDLEWLDREMERYLASGRVPVVPGYEGTPPPLPPQDTARDNVTFTMVFVAFLACIAIFVAMMNWAVYIGAAASFAAALLTLGALHELSR